ALACAGEQRSTKRGVIASQVFVESEEIVAKQLVGGYQELGESVARLARACDDIAYPRVANQGSENLEILASKHRDRGQTGLGDLEHLQRARKARNIDDDQTVERFIERAQSLL